MIIQSASPFSFYYDRMQLRLKYFIAQLHVRAILQVERHPQDYPQDEPYDQPQAGSPRKVLACPRKLDGSGQALQWLSFPFARVNGGHQPFPGRKF